MPGTLAIPHTFSGEQTDSVASIDANFVAIRDYVNARVPSVGLVANRPAAGSAGAIYFATDQSILYLDNGAAWIVAATLGASTGDIKLRATATVESGWLACDGAAVSRVTYAALFAAIGTAFGVGDGATTFNVPDFRDRLPMGASGTKAVGSAAGAETHAITTAEMPSHTHTASGTVWNSGIAGTVAFAGSDGTGASGTPAVTVATAGSGTAMSLLNPYRAVGYMIKT